MSIFMRGACALLIGAAMSGTAIAQNVQGEGVQTLFEGVTNESGAVELTGCNCDVDYDTYGGSACELGCDTGCCDSGCGGGGLGGCPGQVFFGAEWLNVRAEFSEATAYRELDALNSTETFHQFNMNYGSSYRLYGGYRLCECGCDITFAYTNFNSGGGFASGEAQAGTTTITAPFEVDAAPGDSLYGNSEVDIDNYDLGFSKTIPLGCRLQCGGCGDCADCCDPCGCGPVCPAWDITWSGGIRFANVDSTLNYYNVRGPANTGSPARSATSRVDFNGAGLRFGMLGRHYFGRQGLVSAYIKGDISLLLGDVDYSVTGSQQLNDVTFSSTQVIPVTEIEAGLTGYLTSNVTVSAGYLLSAWHDLGHRAEYDFTAITTQINSMDDANLMTLDGLFIRAEAAF
ncbi:hypothetical protein MalM25_30860 [Planctomycetes bacterium MalM25]|nr:hypothetical protein MalM25_30860 [Planctomycetes bacterium MalM25]